MRKRFLAVLPAVAAWTLLTASPASASVTWDGEASQGTGVFGNIECPAPGGVVGAAQTDGHGTVWRYTKAVGLDRCESRGIRVGGTKYAFQNNSTYYLGWESKLSHTSLPTGDFVVFQWKSYPNATQNYPLLMTVDNDRVNLVYVGTDAAWHTIWSAPVAAWDWHRFVLAIHTSDSATGGWTELWFDGVKQTFTNGSTRYTGRTWDSANEPKWGVYDRDHPDSEVVNRIDSLKLGTAYADVD
ncbi:heparin lyase I family protein [Streptomyces formicae]|uniref:Heparin lyase I family protein n=1 Tax=Streptomyces formicae TaxID=1616117 RepID=A0ABY3WN80_9ACTN|nr:heparin lyase I family protein [Streptomyces formicae]UNM12772.1 heparin lyase I family protein [Streptomyces formicae]